MLCQRCGRVDASWLDEYLDQAVCNTCCPDRTDPYGMSFVRPLVRADAIRLSTQDRRRGGGR
jgi:hypothetical protein